MRNTTEPLRSLAQRYTTVMFGFNTLKKKKKRLRHFNPNEYRTVSAEYHLLALHLLLTKAPTLPESLRNTLKVPDRRPPVPKLNINVSTRQMSEDQMF